MESRVYCEEVDTSTMERPTTFNLSLLNNPTKGPINQPICLEPKIKPIKWFQIWRYKDKQKYIDEVKRCRDEFQNIFGNPNVI